jgi:hypothetical protein
MQGWYSTYPVLALRREGCLAMMVEVNTFFKIGKRYFTAPGLDLIMRWGDAVTWVATRLVLYPYIVHSTIQKWLVHSADPAVDSYFNPCLLLLCLIMALTALNYKWTADILLRQDSVRRSLNLPPMKNKSSGKFL